MCLSKLLYISHIDIEKLSTSYPQTYPQPPQSSPFSNFAYHRYRRNYQPRSQNYETRSHQHHPDRHTPTTNDRHTNTTRPPHPQPHSPPHQNHQDRNTNITRPHHQPPRPPHHPHTSSLASAGIAATTHKPLHSPHASTGHTIHVLV